MDEEVEEQEREKKRPELTVLGYKLLFPVLSKRPESFRAIVSSLVSINFQIHVQI